MVTVNDEEDKKSYLHFGTDSAGRPLRYKILIKNNHVLIQAYLQVEAVLYNTGHTIERVKFREQQYILGELGTILN